MRFNRRNLKAILLSVSLLTAGMAPVQAMNDGIIVDKHLNSIKF